MKVERVSEDLYTPFVTITLTRKEAGILKQLVNYNINNYSTNTGRRVFDQHEDVNGYFAVPLHKKLYDLGV